MDTEVLRKLRENREKYKENLSEFESFCLWSIEKHEMKIANHTDDIDKLMRREFKKIDRNRKIKENIQKAAGFLAFAIFVFGLAEIVKILIWGVR